MPRVRISRTQVVATQSVHVEVELEENAPQWTLHSLERRAVTLLKELEDDNQAVEGRAEGEDSGAEESKYNMLMQQLEWKTLLKELEDDNQEDE